MRKACMLVLCLCLPGCGGCGESGELKELKTLRKKDLERAAEMAAEEKLRPKLSKVEAELEKFRDKVVELEKEKLTRDLQQAADAKAKTKAEADLAGREAAVKKKEDDARDREEALKKIPEKPPDPLPKPKSEGVKEFIDPRTVLNLKIEANQKVLDSLEETFRTRVVYYPKSLIDQRNRLYAETWRLQQMRGY